MFDTDVLQSEKKKLRNKKKIKARKKLMTHAMRTASRQTRMEATGPTLLKSSNNTPCENK